MADSNGGAGEQEYMDDSSAKMKFVPENEFEHANELMSSEMESDSDVLNNFSKIVDKHVQLSNIGSDTMMRFNQNDVVLLTHMFSMAARDEALIQPCKVMFFGWRGEMLLTKAKGGLERKMQAQVGTKFVSKEQLPGYGATLDSMMSDKQEENFLSRFFNRGKNKQQGGQF